jgi:hypothetical protein
MVTAHLMVQASMVTIQIITESRPLETLLGKSSVTEDFFPRPSDDLFTHHAADSLASIVSVLSCISSVVPAGHGHDDR